MTCQACSHSLREGNLAEQDLRESPGPSHPIIRRHPETGRSALYLGRQPNAWANGLSLQDSEALLDELWSYALAPELTWHHQWRLGGSCTARSERERRWSPVTGRNHRPRVRGALRREGRGNFGGLMHASLDCSTIASPGCIIAAGLLAFALPAIAQDYPSKPIRIVTAAAGGGSDFVARLLAQGISGPLGQGAAGDYRPAEPGDPALHQPDESEGAVPEGRRGTLVDWLAARHIVRRWSSG